MEVGLCHPPVGLNLYVVITFWPPLSLWLPHLLFK